MNTVMFPVLVCQYPHPCSVGTAEIDSVNHGKGVNHGKDWDYAQINIAP